MSLTVFGGSRVEPRQSNQLAVIKLLRLCLVFESTAFKKAYFQRRAGEELRHGDPGSTGPDYAEVGFNLEAILQSAEVGKHFQANLGHVKKGADLSLALRENPAV